MASVLLRKLSDGCGGDELEGVLSGRLIRSWKSPGRGQRQEGWRKEPGCGEVSEDSGSAGTSCRREGMGAFKDDSAVSVL